jgi:hypothetical protein
MESISLTTVSPEVKVALLRELGYDSDGEYVVTGSGERHHDKYTNELVRLEHMLILPGSTIIIDNNPFSIASYLEEYGDIF